MRREDKSGTDAGGIRFLLRARRASRSRTSPRARRAQLLHPAPAAAPSAPPARVPPELCSAKTRDGRMPAASGPFSAPCARAETARPPGTTPAPRARRGPKRRTGRGFAGVMQREDKRRDGCQRHPAPSPHPARGQKPHARRAQLLHTAPAGAQTPHPRGFRRSYAARDKRRADASGIRPLLRTLRAGRNRTPAGHNSCTPRPPRPQAPHPPGFRRSYAARRQERGGCQWHPPLSGRGINAGRR